MNEYLGMVQLDHGIEDAFWAALFTALFLGLGWIISTGFKRMENRHKRAENKLEDVGENISDVRYNTKLPPWRSKQDKD